MRFFGLHFGHDAGCAVFNDKGELEFYGQCERYFPRWKTYPLNMDPIMAFFPKLKPTKDDVIVVTALGEDQVDKVDGYDPAVVTKPLHDGTFLGYEGRADLIIDHHLAHAVSSWCFRTDDKERLFVTFDGAGSSADGVLKYSLVGSISGTGFSYYSDAAPIPSSIPLCELLGNNSAGKAMGLAGYRATAPEFKWDDKTFNKYFEMTLDPSKHCAPRYPRVDGPLTPDKMDFVASFYKYVTNMIGNAVEENIRALAKGRGVVLGGGTALALEINTRVHNLVGDVVFGPPINDSGLALGAAAFGYFHAKKVFPKVPGPSIMALQKPLPKIGPQEPGDIARMVAQDKVVGLLRGMGEAGPRALGYRSILASAMKATNLKRVSEQIKGREFYRPLAPVVTSEAFDRYFVGPKGEYMQYRVTCTDEARKFLPAIVHADNSSRPQVVYKERDPWLHSLLVRHGEMTGHPIMINTSLNGPGKPICNTYEDAAADMKGKEVVLVSIPQPETVIG